MMDDVEKDDAPMLSATHWPSDKYEYTPNPNQNRKLSNRSRSFSISMPAMASTELTSRSKNVVSFTGPLHPEKRSKEARVVQENTKPYRTQWGDKEAKNEHLMKSGPLGMCSDPYCTTCPSSYYHKGRLVSRVPHGAVDHHLHAYGGANRWVREKLSLLMQFTLGVMNPHAKFVQKWNQFVIISCLFAIFIDPVFFYLLSVQKEQKCIFIHWPMTKIIVIFRSMTDFIYLLHMLVQFRLAFISPESRVVGAGDLVDDPRKIALHYLSGYFFLDLFVVLPLPQIIVLLVLPSSISFGATHAQNLLRSAVLVQYIPRLYRFLPLLAGQSPTNFIFESAWANFVINLLTYVLAGHVVGSCWYLFGLQRVNLCLRCACEKSGFRNCTKFIDCGHGNDFGRFTADPDWNKWKQNVNASACFDENDFQYGIYMKAVNLTAENSMTTRYVYSFFWGFQQISTLAGNQTPSYYVSEVLFTLGIIALGLLLFALLIGNMQNFLQGLGRRRLEKSLRRRDVEQWMSHRLLPEELKRKVRESERYNWAATQGVEEEKLMENLPEDLQRDIRRHLFKFVKKVRIFSLMDEPILDAICERIRPTTYIEGGTPLNKGGHVTKMVFIVRGKMESIGEDGTQVPLSEGDVCGEELLTWLDHSSHGDTNPREQRKAGQVASKRTVTCLTNVEAFILKAADLEQVTTLFATFLSDHRVQMAIKNESPYWRSRAATTIQLAWRYWKKRRNRAGTSHSGYTYPSNKLRYY